MRAAVWGLGVLLFVQALFLFRHDISRTLPATRAFFVAVCGSFGCAMPLPRDKSLIKISDNDWGIGCRDDDSGVCTLHAEIMNQEEFEQDWPHLELTLLNAIKQPIARRAFTPQQWAPTQLLEKGSIPPLTTVDVNLDIKINAKPEYFRVESFYP
ncbi:MAG: DUF3426 domain-containing protein [Azoarcus sp.]|nr:DUF3426 domain-containing protein [Azoarcus sp.]